MPRLILVLLAASMLPLGAIVWPGGMARAANVEFTEEFLNDPEVVAAGRKIFRAQCGRCHGLRAYPGKGPVLKPKKYKPAFVYKRVTKGFRGMPAWKKFYDKEQRMSVTAYIMSKDFKN